MSMADTQHFCLRWNNYQSSITSAFENLRDDEDFVDVTLACDGKSLKAHRVVLSACSPYFRELLKSTPCKHPVIVLQDVAFADLHALVEFIYHGEVNVHQRNLSSFLKTAEVLRVSGLTQQAEDRDEFPAQLQGSRGHQQSFSDKLVEDALFTSPPSPPPPSQHSNATSGGATVNQLLRRAAAAAAIASSSSRRERHNSAEQQSDSSEQSQHSAPSKRARTSANVENSNHNNGETTSASTNQVTATDFSSSFSSKQTQGSTTGSNNRKTESDGNVASGDGDSSPSPTSGMLDGVKSEPLELLCGAADMDNSNDSVEATGGDAPAGSHQQSSLSAGDHDDHDSIQGHPGSVYLSTPESKLFASATSTGSFNFSMAALAADPTGLSGIGSQSIQGNADGAAGTSSQEGPSGQVLLFLPSSRFPRVDAAAESVHRCDVCGKMLSTRLTLKRHKEQQHLQPLHNAVCNVCNKVFRTMNSLNNHRSIYHRRAKGAVKLLNN
ncbi:broad-complex core protein isoform X6 [Cryptotermes secundus]|uniref:broad-complex core protein isoform X6 n=1 Tax=Cryptotermes secundus TaxID=105785 RepID=UPI000CD7D8F5|nr:broad-complex core protein isoform X6 [Cryptotermes secundus]